MFDYENEDDDENDLTALVAAGACCFHWQFQFATFKFYRHCTWKQAAGR